MYNSFRVSLYIYLFSNIFFSRSLSLLLFLTTISPLIRHCCLCTHSIRIYPYLKRIGGREEGWEIKREGEEKREIRICKEFIKNWKERNVMRSVRYQVSMFRRVACAYNGFKLAVSRVWIVCWHTLRMIRN